MKIVLLKLQKVSNLQRYHHLAPCLRHLSQLLSSLPIMKFRPCIDLHSGKVKQIIGSTLIDKTNDSSNSSSTPDENFSTDKPASEYAEMYKRDGLRGGHVVMLGGGNVDAVRRNLLMLLSLDDVIVTCIVILYQFRLLCTSSVVFIRVLSMY
jgi:hypothetical protein